MVGHAKASVTNKYIHSLDTARIMAADTITGYVQGLLDRKAFKRRAHVFDRCSRKAALARFLRKAAGKRKRRVLKPSGGPPSLPMAADLHSRSEPHARLGDRFRGGPPASSNQLQFAPIIQFRRAYASTKKD